ncbi:MAG: hypothetical protein JO215_01085 [Ktedonobacteraceae bacterium]|nr:hypothetical protein [Ktedonobacteraceae bacterium]MBV9709582.1 hypothetical protein [Ktedonobacteraceae bacterium]
MNTLKEATILELAATLNARIAQLLTAPEEQFSLIIREWQKQFTLLIGEVVTMTLEQLRQQP